MTPNVNFLENGTTTFFQPQGSRALSTNDRIQNRLAVLVGFVAFGLPVVLAAGALFGGSCFRDSISHFYYAQFLGSIFVGLLIFIGGFLIAYTGDHWLEDAGSLVAGLGACFVALFPTLGNGCEAPTSFLSRVFVQVTRGEPETVTAVEGRGFFELFGDVGHIHAWGAGILFAYLGLYCLIVLKRIVPERHLVDGQLVESKRRRNRIYSYCGVVILLCVAALGLVALLAGEGFLQGWNAWNMTFIVETIALWAFGLAWIIKGRWFSSLNEAGLATAL